MLIINTQQPIARYTYDSLGNRVSKTVYTKTNPPQTTYYAYDNAHKLIAEAESSTNTNPNNTHITKQYLYTDHRLHSLLQGNAIYAVSTDWRGLPQRVTDANKQTVWQQTFDDWGNQLTPSPFKGEGGGAGKIAQSANSMSRGAQSMLFTLNIRLAGQYYDAETGLHYNIHRYYNPQAINPQTGQPTGRYISPDPLGTPDGNDRYAYLNGNPHAGIDQLGLFEVPASVFAGTFAGFTNVTSASFDPDQGHGDILKIAFAMFNSQPAGVRFSETIINQIIANNYHSDANGGSCYFGTFISGGGQCHTQNHFDNPNDGSIYNADGTKKVNYNNDPSTWIQDGLDQIIANRQKYDDVQVITKQVNGITEFGANISVMLNAFGQNSHALADFYAHTNWVDAKTRGGCYQVPVLNAFGNLTKKPATVPNVLAQTTLWNEDANIKNLYSGTVESIAAVKTAQSQYHSHAYWNKDANKPTPGEVAFTNEEKQVFINNKLFFWESKIFDPNNLPKNPISNLDGSLSYGVLGVDYFTDNGKYPKAGDNIYVRRLIVNHHQLAFQLAIQHTLAEIQRLYDATANIQFPLTTATGQQIKKTLHEVFKLDAVSVNNTTLDNKPIDYQTLYIKKTDGGIKP